MTYARADLWLAKHASTAGLLCGGGVRSSMTVCQCRHTRRTADPAPVARWQTHDLHEGIRREVSPEYLISTNCTRVSTGHGLRKAHRLASSRWGWESDRGARARRFGGRNPYVFLGVSDQICAVCQESTTNSMLLARGGMPKYVTLDETVCYLQVVLVIK